MIHSSQASNVKQSYHKSIHSSYSRRTTAASLRALRVNSVNSSQLEGTCNHDDLNRSRKNFDENNNNNEPKSFFSCYQIRHRITNSLLNALKNMNKKEGNF
ncbi:unnamed protein product [Brachionus calyciflorus]|uniref:Uncharacterized protein n=1 Tax=Brachionus calyciflorus TaxID=104777 RepID=A0A813ZDV3_9BILA|nr:unnamed protein product [Brachionus calyciflorus]